MIVRGNGVSFSAQATFSYLRNDDHDPSDKGAGNSPAKGGNSDGKGEGNEEVGEGGEIRQEHEGADSNLLDSSDEGRMGRATGQTIRKGFDRRCRDVYSMDDRARMINELIRSVESKVISESEMTEAGRRECKPLARAFRLAANVSYRVSSAADQIIFEGHEASTLTNVFGALVDFGNEYCKMVAFNTIGADRFFHCVANCKAASRGTAGLMTAAVVSIARETDNFFRTNPGKGLTIVENIADCSADMLANVVGMRSGFEGVGVRCEAACGNTIGYPDCYPPSQWE